MLVANKVLDTPRKPKSVCQKMHSCPDHKRKGVGASLPLWSAEAQEPSNRETHITESWALGLLELTIIPNKLITIYKGS